MLPPCFRFRLSAGYKTMHGKKIIKRLITHYVCKRNDSGENIWRNWWYIDRFLMIIILIADNLHNLFLLGTFRSIQTFHTYNVIYWYAISVFFKTKLRSFVWAKRAKRKQKSQYVLMIRYFFFLSAFEIFLITVYGQIPIDYALFTWPDLRLHTAKSVRRHFWKFVKTRGWTIRNLLGGSHQDTWIDLM